jgi:hypothetical protein
MNPEQLAPGRGEMPACPYCNANLNLADLFGVKDSFVGLHDDEGNDHSLDDLVGGQLYDNRYADGMAPPPERPVSQARPAPRAASRPAPSQPKRRALPGPSAPSRPNGLVRRGPPADAPAGGGGGGGQPSALDLLREMKKKR